MQKKKIAIIGAGLAGLNCARLLEKDFDITLFDKNSSVGGRILSTHQDGHILDHGFQVFLPDYPEARSVFDYKKLDLMSFTPGALIRMGEKYHKFSDPLRKPADLLSTFFAPIGNLKDKLLILKLKRAVKNPDKQLHNISTYSYLKNFGFSEDIINHFFKPFFSGVFLERDLNTSAFFFSFIFSLFSKCNATVPRKGMMELPLNILGQLKETKLELNSNIKNITSNSITANGEMRSFDYVICAFDSQSTEFQTVTTDYFETNDKIVVNPTLYLNGTGKGVINHIAPMTAASSSYSQRGKFLWSVNLLTPNENTPVETVYKELNVWFPKREFTHLKRFTIKKALPSEPRYGIDNIIKDGIYLCGDQMQGPSINGALKSARIVAEKILSIK